MKYVEKHFTLRIHRRDGTSKLLLGVTGHPPRLALSSRSKWLRMKSSRSRLWTILAVMNRQRR